MKKILCISLVALGVAACGGGSGGGGGGGGSSSSGTVVPTAVISNSNQGVVAQDTTTGSFAPLMGAQSLTGVDVSNDSAIFAAVREQIDNLPQYMAQAVSQPHVAGVVSSSTSSCTLGGSLSASVNDADNSSTVTAGDSVTITANNCVLAQGTISGSMTLAVGSWSGSLTSSPPNYNMSLTISYSNFNLVASSYTSSLNGSMSTTIRAVGNYTQYASVSATSLTASATFLGVSRTRTLSNYTASYQRAPDANYVSHTDYTVSGALSSSGLGVANTFTFSTVTPMRVLGAQTYPSSGQVVITGASNTRLRLTALSNTQVQEELDANGDGSYENTSVVNWNTLL
jgi:hypothetical protein